MKITNDHQSLEECRESIKMLANNIAMDISSTFVNQCRIDGLRSLLDLFDEYNKQLIKMKKLNLTRSN